MPIRIPGIFEKYDFIEESELIGAKTFTPLQMMYLQTLQAEYSQALLGVSAEGSKFENAEIFLREHQYLRGKIECLAEIIAEHDRIQERQTQEAQEHSTLQAFRDAYPGPTTAS